MHFHISGKVYTMLTLTGDQVHITKWHKSNFFFFFFCLMISFLSGLRRRKTPIFLNYTWATFICCPRWDTYLYKWPYLSRSDQWLFPNAHAHHCHPSSSSVSTAVILLDVWWWSSKTGVVFEFPKKSVCAYRAFWGIWVTLHLPLQMYTNKIDISNLFKNLKLCRLVLAVVVQQWML